MVLEHPLRFSASLWMNGYKHTYLNILEWVHAVKVCCNLQFLGCILLDGCTNTTFCAILQFLTMCLVLSCLAESCRKVQTRGEFYGVLSLQVSVEHHKDWEERVRLMVCYFQCYCYCCNKFSALPCTTILPFHSFSFNCSLSGPDYTILTRQAPFPGPKR